MGRKSRKKKERKDAPRNQIVIDQYNKPAPMDPVLIEAYTRGRELGRRQGYEQAKADAVNEITKLFKAWIENIDEIPDIGKRRKGDVIQYINKRIREYVEGKEAQQEEWKLSE